MADIGVLVTSFRRPHTLRKQLAAIRGQSLAPARIVVFHNHGGVEPDRDALRECEVVACNFNSGVWPRMAFAAWAFKNEYVCVFDDDTVPGPKWFENCMSCLDSSTIDLCGATGVIFHEGQRHLREYVGGHGNKEAVDVDIVGHSWFAPRYVYCRAVGTPRPVPMHDTAGEDYHLSYSVQLQGCRTVVPAQPFDAPDMHGSLHRNLGVDGVALWSTEGEEEKKLACHQAYLKRGWKPLAITPTIDNFEDRCCDKAEIFEGDGVSTAFERACPIHGRKTNCFACHSGPARSSMLCAEHRHNPKSICWADKRRRIIK